MSRSQYYKVSTNESAKYFADNIFSTLLITKMSKDRPIFCPNLCQNLCFALFLQRLKVNPNSLLDHPKDGQEIRKRISQILAENPTICADHDTISQMDLTDGDACQFFSCMVLAAVHTINGYGIGPNLLSMNHSIMLCLLMYKVIR